MDWNEIEWFLRNDEELDHTPVVVDSLKTSLIGLMGCKLFGDKNEVFYDNTKQTFHDNIEQLIDIHPYKARILKSIQIFVNEKL